MKIIDYKVLEAGDGDDLSREAQQAIQEGWQPFGSLSTTPPAETENYSTKFWYAQAVVKYEEVES